MALYHKCDVKNDFGYVLQFFSLISDSLGSVIQKETNLETENNIYYNFIQLHDSSKGIDSK